MADPVQDREAVADKRYILVAGDVFPVGVADQKIDRFVLDPLMQEVDIGLRTVFNVCIRKSVAEYRADALFEAFAGRAADDMDRFHVQVKQKFGKRDKVIRISEKRNFPAVEVLLHIGHQIDQPSSFVRYRFRYFYPCSFAQAHQESIGSPQPDRNVFGFERNPAFFVEGDSARLPAETP